MDNYATHKTPNSKRGSPAGRITMSTSPRLPHHGSIKSNAGSLSSPESKSSEAFTPPSGSSRLTSVPSSTCTTKTQSPSNGPSPLTRFWLQSNASVTKLSRLYMANFRLTRLGNVDGLSDTARRKRCRFLLPLSHNQMSKKIARNHARLLGLDERPCLQRGPMMHPRFGHRNDSFLLPRKSPRPNKSIQKTREAQRRGQVPGSCYDRARYRAA